MKTNYTNRREFLETTSKAGGAAAIAVMSPQTALRAQSNSKLQVGIIGTGGRGNFDGRNIVKTGRAEVVALADYFDFQMTDQARQFNVSKQACFDGIDGYKELLALDQVDAVILTTPPYFRPEHFAAAVDAGKHVFAEKPIAVDPWGCRQVLETGKQAAEKKLTVVAGLQSRYDEAYRQYAEMIHAGAIGRPVVGHSQRMGGDLWRRERPANFSERDHQVRHWLYYKWGSGDFIDEMHIHDLDIFNWFTGSVPESAYGRGGRDVRLDVGDIYDHISVIYEYADGFHFAHTGMQIPVGYDKRNKQIIGTEGAFDSESGLTDKDKQKHKFTSKKESTLIEMEQFIASINGEVDYINNTEYVVTSTFTCILGRTAAYRNEKVMWKELWESNEKLEIPS